MDVELLGLGGALGRGQLLKWRQILDLVNPNVCMLKVVLLIFEMAAMPLPCNGFLWAIYLGFSQCLFLHDSD